MLLMMDGAYDDTDIDLDDDRPEEWYLDGIRVVSTAAGAAVRNPVWMV